MAQLIVTFGGLCMFVQKKTDPKGLYVLMPEGHVHAGKQTIPHCPMLLTTTDTPDGTMLMSSYAGIQLGEEFGFMDSGMSPVPIPPQILRMSHFARARVKARHFTGPIGEGLAARIRMPLGTTIQADSTDKFPLATPDNVRAEYAGQATVAINVAGPPTVGGRLIAADDDGNYPIFLVNVPRAHLDGELRQATMGESSNHLQAYYALMNGFSPTHPSGPKITFGRDQAGEPETFINCPGPRDAPVELPFPPIHFIDSANCTIGHGCEDDPDC